MIDVIETVYRGASKGRGLVVAPKGKFVPAVHTADCRLLDTAQVLESPFRISHTPPFTIFRHYYVDNLFVLMHLYAIYLMINALLYCTT
jgi:hypothetical protein